MSTFYNTCDGSLNITLGDGRTIVYREHIIPPMKHSVEKQWEKLFNRNKRKVKKQS